MLEERIAVRLRPPGSCPRLVFIGTGYLGATHAVCFAALGHEVLGVDVDEAKVAKLNNGELPFSEPGLQELLSDTLASGRLRFTSSYAEAADFGEVHFLCVGTPQQQDGRAADLTYLNDAMRSLAPQLRRKTLIVGKSTVPVGTAALLRRVVAELCPAHSGVELAWSPEFLREGLAVEDVLRPDRLIFGADNDDTHEAMRAAYHRIYELAEAEGRELPTITTSLATAELTKMAANSFLATKISFINAMADVCEAAGADVTELAQGMGLDPRIGPGFLRAGIGYGGGCLPKDVRAFHASAEELGVGDSLRFLHEVELINQKRRSRIMRMAETAAGGLAGATVAVQGVTFKSGSDDIRESPALHLVGELIAAGAIVSVYDPEGMENARRVQPAAHYAPTVQDALREADLVLVLTEWAEFRTADPAEFGALVRNRRVIDGRNCLDPVRWRSEGWEYFALGRPAENSPEPMTRPVSRTAS